MIFLIGAFSSLGFAPFYFFPVTILSYVILIYFLKDYKKKKIFLYGLFYGLGTNLGTLY